MSQTATPEPIPAEVLPAHESDNLWTADSERQPPELQTSDPVHESPAESDASREPEVAAPPVEAAAERDETGKFKARSDKKRDNPYARVKDATAKEAAAKEDARIAREEAAALRARIEALEQGSRPKPEAPASQQPQPQNGNFPKDTDWLAANPELEYGDYIDARARFVFQQLQQAQQQQQMVQNYHQRLEAAKAADPTLVQALANDPPISPVMERAILSSPNSIDIVRYLGTHPEDCAQLARESATTSFDAVPVMRRYLEAQVTAGAGARPDSASVVKPSTANPPINRVGGTASATPVDPDDLPFGPDYIRSENLREKKRQESSRW